MKLLEREGPNNTSLISKKTTPETNTKFCTINPYVIHMVQKLGWTGCLFHGTGYTAPPIPGYDLVGFYDLPIGRSRFDWKLDAETLINFQIVQLPRLQILYRT